MDRDLRPLHVRGSGLWTGAVTDRVVVDVRVALDADPRAAWARLRILVHGGMLSRASEAAYGEGVTDLVKLAGPAAGLTRLADVYVEDLTETGDRAHIALQWDAIGADGRLFTTLLADLTLIPGEGQTTALTLTGTCWPPPGQAGAGPDQAMARRWATAVSGSLLNTVACELAHPAGTAGHARPGPVPGPRRPTS